MILNHYKSHLKFSFILLLTFLFTVKANAQTVQESSTDQKPNILFILMDDMGYGDIGVLTQNKRKLESNLPLINTPNLDKLSNEGALLTNHYASAPVCAPSRASLLSGLSQGHANVRDNQFDKALANNYTMANVLGDIGYNTAIIGKWGLQGSDKFDKDGDKWPGYPLNRGFDYFYGYVRHNDGHEHYPFEGKYDGKKEVYENRSEISNQLAKCYTGDLFTAKAKNWITEQAVAKKPFFLFLSYDTPHAVTELPTQAYPAGKGLNGGLQFLNQPGKMINTASGEIDSWINPDYVNATYDDDHNPETAEIPWPNVYKRYATVITRIDKQLGDLMALLTDLKISKNTIIVFTSDNGPSIESYLKQPFKANFFDSFGPFSGIKRDLLEGGSRVPTIVKWPNKISPKQIISEPSISYDWLPTFADAAGFASPVNGNGISLIPSLTQNVNNSRLIYSEYFVGGKSPDYKEFPNAND
ncbi:sulfatase-like hydrolase/transferase [Pedobacter arcticus]|uniref:sulfatase-like hydrolase/transferase n=1 Tax=Pedobacter arcticus TaxID=752140 RepID=UPI0006860C83|nr:sulfatase-like hydrolase/transferase [Pedobacter arcticus]